jgi:hypothetical protein
MSKAKGFLNKLGEDMNPEHHHSKEGSGYNNPDQVFDGVQKDCPICKTGDKSTMMAHEEFVGVDDLADPDKRWIIDTERKAVDSPYDGPEYNQVIIKAKTEKEAKEKFAEYDDLKDNEIKELTQRDKFATNQMGYEKERKEFDKIQPEGVKYERPDPKKNKDWYMYDLD